MMLLFRVTYWLCSVPAWITLILHFTVGLPLWWFWATLGVWIVGGIFWYLIVLAARKCAASPAPVQENKNPYSKSNDDLFPHH